MKTPTAILLLAALTLTSACGAPALESIDVNPSALAASWSVDPDAVTCSGIVTPFDGEAKNCEWSCAIYQGSLHDVRVHFPASDTGFTGEAEVTARPCGAGG